MLPCTRGLPTFIAWLSEKKPMQPTSPFSEISTNTSIYPPRTTLYCQGEHLNGVFIIRRGAVKLTMISNNGKSVILGFAYPGNILGLSEFFSHAPSSALAETTMECLLSYVQCPNFQNFLSGHVEAAIEVARQATGSYQNACRQISLLALSVRCRTHCSVLAQRSRFPACRIHQFSWLAAHS